MNKDEVDTSVLEHEPHLALFADEELTVYKNIFESLPKLKKDHLLCVFEIGYDLKEKITKLLEKTVKNATFGFVKDINGKERILILEMR